MQPDEPTAEWLIALKSALDNKAAALKAEIEKFNAMVERRYAGDAKAKLLAAGKDTGTAHVQDGDVDVVVTIPKKVDWDQPKLKAALDSLDPDTARHYAKVSVSVDERKFDAAPPEIQNILSPARTVTPGKPKIEFKQKEAA